MPHFLSTITLTSVLLLAPLGLEARTTARAPAATPAPETLLSGAELLCAKLGAYAFAVAASRDGGATLSSSLSRARQVFQTDPAAASLQVLIERITHDVYAHPLVPPVFVRQTTERLCLEDNPFMPRGPAASDAKLRY